MDQQLYICITVVTVSALVHTRDVTCTLSHLFRLKYLIIIVFSLIRTVFLVVIWIISVTIWKPTRKALHPMFHSRNIDYIISNTNAKSRILVNNMSTCVRNTDFNVFQSITLSSTISFTLGESYSVISVPIVLFIKYLLFRFVNM